MNLLADESVDGPIVERLRRVGHHVRYVAELEPGISDEVVLSLANQEESVLLTADKDFGELVFRQRRIISGVILIRLAGLAPKDKADIVVSVVSERVEELLHSFTVIAPKVVRIRKLSD